MSPVILILSMLACAAAPPAPAEPACEPLLGPRLRAGCWGPLLIRVTNSSGAIVQPLVLQGSGDARLSFDAGGNLAPSAQAEFVLFVRPSRADATLSADLGGVGVDFPGRVTGEGSPIVVEIRVSPGPRLPLPVDMQSQVPPGRLPAVAAGYEALDLMVISELPEGSLSTAQSRALAEWFRAGGRAVITSQNALAVAGPLLLPGWTATTKPASRADWERLLGKDGGGEAEWEGDRPLVASFSLGFGRGLLVLPRRDGSVPDWSRAARDVWASHSPRTAPMARPRMYVDPAGSIELPALANSMPGASAALRWSLGAVLAMAAAGAALGRRKSRWRLPIAVSAAGLFMLGLLLVAVRPGPAATLSLRVDEFSPDGIGVRAREYLYIEKTGTEGEISITAADGVLPSPILYRAEESAGLSFAASGLAAPGPTRVRLEGLEFSGPSLFLGAGPLPGTEVMSRPPAGASAVSSLAGLDRARALQVVADCLDDKSGRCRAQAEFLAGMLLPEIMVVQGSLESSNVTVCRLPEDRYETAMTAGPRVSTVRLGRLGVFYEGER